MSSFKKCITIIMLCWVSVTISAQNISVNYLVPDEKPMDNHIIAVVLIRNNLFSSIDLRDLTLKYWYRRESNSADVFVCDWAVIGTDNVHGTFSQEKNMDVCTISFSGGGILGPRTNTGGIMVRWHPADWSNYDELNDYSYGGDQYSYSEWTHITLYYHNQLIWGEEPGDIGEQTPTPSAPQSTPTPVGSIQKILFEAEDYIDYNDTTNGNDGLFYRTDDVDIEACLEGSYNIGWIETGEWLDYDFHVEAQDTFDIHVRVASATGAHDAFSIVLDNKTVTPGQNVPNTGAWQSWDFVTIPGYYLTAGTHRLRINLNGGFNLDYFYLTTANNGPVDPPRPDLGPLPEAPSWYKGVVSEYGQLRVQGKDLVAENGVPVQLKGMNSHGLHWYPFFVGYTVPNLAYDWGIDIIRPAMYVEDYKDGAHWYGYLENPDFMLEQVEGIIKDAINVGIYVVIDWHIHNDPNNFTDAALDFFTMMAERYGEYPNVIYEICNEPEYTSWESIKNYANTIIPAIRAIDPDNIILVGTPNWNQDLDVAADSPLTGYTNIMYALHFYAGTHSQAIRDKADYALNKGLPVFISEWGASDSTGGSNGQVYLAETEKWLNWANARNLSWINWNFGNKNEASAALLPGVSIQGPWSDQDLSASGIYVKRNITVNQAFPTAAPVCSLKLQYKDGGQTTWLNPLLKIINTGQGGVNLADMKIRYYYTRDGGYNEEAQVWYASCGVSNVHIDLSNTSYTELSFSGFTLSAGNECELNIAWHKVDWSPYNLENDYSTNKSFTEFRDYSQITVYKNNVLVWGAEP